MVPTVTFSVPSFGIALDRSVHADDPALLAFMANGGLQPSGIVGQRLALGDAQQGLEAMDTVETVGFSVITTF